MARNIKLENDQLREENRVLTVQNLTLELQIAKAKNLQLKICVETNDRLMWLCQNQDKLSWMLKLNLDEERGVIAPYFHFFDESDEMVYKFRYSNSILEQALTM